tara:strand:- start:603 stop:860 length:258 start_codon:yes stop_codon:yes gene_type:complete
VKYLLVDKGDNIVDTVELGSQVGLNGARTFFIGRKQIDKKEFDNMWKVVSEEQYNTESDLTNRQNKQYEWWKDDESYLDIDKYEE